MASRLEIKQQVVREMGRYELVTDYANGDWSANASAPVNIDKVIQDAQVRLDEMPWKLREQLIKRSVSLATGTYEFDLPKPLRGIKRIDLETATERNVPELYQQSMGYMRENYPEPFSLVDSSTPIDWARQIPQGLTVDTDVVLNGDFETDLSSWTLDAVHAQVYESGACRFYDGSQTEMSQNISACAGEDVTFTINVTDVGNYGVQVEFRNAGGTALHTFVYTETGEHMERFTLNALAVTIAIISVSGCIPPVTTIFDVGTLVSIDPLLDPVPPVVLTDSSYQMTGAGGYVGGWEVFGGALSIKPDVGGNFTNFALWFPTSGHYDRAVLKVTCNGVPNGALSLTALVYGSSVEYSVSCYMAAPGDYTWVLEIPAGVVIDTVYYGAVGINTVSDGDLVVTELYLETDQALAGDSLIDDVSLTYKADNTTKDILIMPPADVDYTAYVFGTVYDDAMTADGDTSIWSTLQPNILVNACKAIIKESSEDWQGAKAYWDLCARELRKIDIGQRKEELMGPPENFVRRG